MVDTKAILSEPLKDIWSHQLFANFCTYKPVAPASVLRNSLLFIGINPSRSKDEKIPIDSEDRCSSHFYSLTQNSNYKYFNKFADIASKTNVQWTHFDLLYMQETNQNIVKHILGQPHGNEFIEKQLHLSKQIFDACSPKVIVVNNSLARDFLKDRLKLKFEFNEDIGTEMYNNVPVFFTSMLTGQRALDNGSYERLVWHIKYAIKKTENNYR